MPLTRLDPQRATEILEARTRQLARRSAVVHAVTQPVLACAVGQEFYGIAVTAVARVLPFAPCARVPGTPQAMLGLFGRAGQLFNVLDLAIALGLDPGLSLGADLGADLGAGLGAGLGSDPGHDPGLGGEAAAGHLLLLRHAPRRFALRVDRVLGVAQVTPLEAPDSSGDRDGAPGSSGPGSSGPGGGSSGAIDGHAPLPPGLLPGPPRLLALIVLERLLQPYLAPTFPGPDLSRSQSFLAPDSRSVTT